MRVCEKQVISEKRAATHSIYRKCLISFASNDIVGSYAPDSGYPIILKVGISLLCHAWLSTISCENHKISEACNFMRNIMIRSHQILCKLRVHFVKLGEKEVIVLNQAWHEKKRYIPILNGWMEDSE